MNTTTDTSPDQSPLHSDTDPFSHIPSETQRTPTIFSKPLIAGILLIIAGVLGIITWFTVFSFDVSLLDPSMFPETVSMEDIEMMLSVCATVGIVLSVFPILSGILAFKRKLWGITLFGAFLGLFTIGPFVLSSILSLVGLILIGVSKQDFKR
jgi:magnesium-transporting ATPase (P-type)